jgi:hypothetical protein
MNEATMRQLDHDELMMVTHGALGKLVQLTSSATQGTFGSMVNEMAGKEPPAIAEARAQFERWASLVGERYRRMAQEGAKS